MDKIGHRADIQYFHIKGLTPKEIHEDMAATLRDNGPSYSMIKMGAADFNRGREDDPRQGRPATVTTQEIIDKIHDILLTDRRLTECFIGTELALCQGRVHAFIRNHLEMTKVAARWVSKLAIFYRLGGCY